MKPIDFESVLLNPTGTFENPADVVSAEGLTREQKIAILKNWELDARNLQVAEDENMAGGEQNRLRQVEEALHSITDTAPVVISSL
jgi:hypothetical protein